MLAIFCHAKQSTLNSSSISDGMLTEGRPGPPFFTTWQGTDITRDGLDALFRKCWRNLSSNSENTCLKSSNVFTSVSSVTILLPFSPWDIHGLKPRSAALCLYLRFGEEFPLSCLKHAQRNVSPLNPLIQPYLFLRWNSSLVPVPKIK